MPEQQKRSANELKRSSSSVNNHTNKKRTSDGLSKSQHMINRIIDFKGKCGTQLIHKYNLPYLITLLDKNKIESIDKVYRIKQDGFNLLQFIRFFLNAIEHSQTQTLYLTMGLVDFFKTISQINNFTQKIKFIHLTDFICNNILQNDGSSQNQAMSITSSNNNQNQNKIQMKLIPSHKPIVPDYQIKDYITNPPTIYGNKEEIVYKLSLTNAKVDKNKHDSVVTASYFSSEHKKIFSLDALSDGISIYDTNCRLQKKLRPQNSKIKKDVVVLSFAYSERQQRIGAVLKDFTLSFWDFVDNLQFEKVVSTASCCQQYQSNIWYLQYFQAWITSDKTGTIYIWNLQKQIPERKIQCKYRGKINDVCQIPCLNILAIAQECRISRLNPNKKENDQAKIILYNYFRGQQVGQISTMTDMRIPHTLQYSQTYQVLLSAGFEKKINIFQINHKYLDTNLKGQLLGHENLITNFILVKKTPMVVSSDDKGKVKIWDMRNYKCIQTLDFRDKTIITRLLDMVEIGKLGVMGSRVNFLQYDQRQYIVKKYQSKQKNIPLSINCIYQLNKLLVVTRKDLRLYNMETGAVQKVFCDYHNKDEQIIVFKYYELMKKVVIGNEKGEIKLFNLGSIGAGKSGNQENSAHMRDQKLQGFQNGLVTHIQYDQDNKLFLTCGENGTINIEKLIKNNSITQVDLSQEDSTEQKLKRNYPNRKFQKSILHNQLLTKDHLKHSELLKPVNAEQWTIIRQMKGNFHNKDVTTLAFSVYHGMIAIGSTCNQIYVWDYEYAKILFCVVLPGGIQPTAMTFLNGFSILVIAAGNGEVYFVKLLRRNQSEYKEKSTYLNNSTDTKTVFTQQISYFKDNRIIKRNKQEIQIIQQEDTNDYITQIMVDISLKGTQSKSQNIQFAKLYFAYFSGKIAILNTTQFLKQFPILPHRKTLPTYNPERQLKQQFSIQLKKDKCARLQLKNNQINDQGKLKFPYNMIKPHNNSINGMKILEFDRHYLCTCGNDERIKLWDEDFNESYSEIEKITLNASTSKLKLLGDFNVNHPLPYLWNFSVKDQKKVRDKIMFSLKIIQSIFKKFGSDISTGQSKILKLQNFFKALDKPLNSSEDSGFSYLTEPLNAIKEYSSKKAYLFHEQFTKKDLHFDEIKKFNFYEIGGPSLRELEFKKKLDDMQKQWQVNKVKEEQEKTHLLSKIQHRAHKNQQKQQIINFLQDRQFIKKRLKKQDEQQFPMVKRMNEEFNKIQKKQSTSALNKDSLVNVSNLSGQMKTLLTSTNINVKLNANKTMSSFVENTAQQKPEYGFMLRKGHQYTAASKMMSSKSSKKDFQQYYHQKICGKNLKTQNSRMNTNQTFDSQFNNFLSLNNSRINSQSSFHQSSKKDQISFQNILKDMNNRVLLSRQARNPKSALNQNFQSGNSAKKYEFPTQRDKGQIQRRTHRHAKSSYGKKFIGGDLSMNNLQRQ